MMGKYPTDEGIFIKPDKYAVHVNSQVPLFTLLVPNISHL